MRRSESRGVHFRVDYPETDDEHFARHIELSRGQV
jgi:succinate dehydrogenase/fumarate reductase flavoprotein subunit